MKLMLSLALGSLLGPVSALADSINPPIPTRPRPQLTILDTADSQALFGLLERSGVRAQEVILDATTGRTKPHKFSVAFLNCYNGADIDGAKIFGCSIGGQKADDRAVILPEELAKDVWTFMTAPGRKIERPEVVGGESRLLRLIQCVGPTKRIDPATGEAKELDTTCAYEFRNGG